MYISIWILLKITEVDHRTRFMYISIWISLKITEVDHRTRFYRPDNHVYIHMDFAEDYRSWSQNEIQSAYWSPTQVATHPVVMYYKNRWEKENIHQSFVFVSSESHHGATFIYTLIGKLVPLLKEIVPNLEMIHYCTDSPTSQYRNKTIFKVISYHEEYFNCKAS